MSNLHKVVYGRDVEFTIRAKDEGSMSDGSLLWSFEHCEGDADADPVDGPEWERGIPSMSGAQVAKFALWLVSTDGIASPHHPGRGDEEAERG